MSRPFTISIVNGKGGVGKTTTAVNLAQIAASQGYRTLLIDGDPQSNSTSILKPSTKIKQRAYADVDTKLMRPTRMPNLWLVASDKVAELVDSAGPSEQLSRFYVLNEILEEAGFLDFCVIDCPPNLGTVAQTAMLASDGVIIPLVVSKFSLDGVKRIHKVMKDVRKHHNTKLKNLGALLTFYNPRSTLSKAIVPELSKTMPVFEATIPTSNLVEEAHMLRKTILEYRPNVKISKEYYKLFDEIEEHMVRKPAEWLEED